MCYLSIIFSVISMIGIVVESRMSYWLCDMGCYFFGGLEFVVEYGWDVFVYGGDDVVG